jgi:hypothetical protein
MTPESDMRSRLCVLTARRATLSYHIETRDEDRYLSEEKMQVVNSFGAWRWTYFLISLCVACGLALPVRAGNGPGLTTVSDTVYRADGVPAQGTMTISWPEFTTAGGDAVAAGSLTVTIGASGALNLSLAPVTVQVAHDRGDISHRAPLPGEPAGGIAEGRAGNFAREREADRVSETGRDRKQKCR